VAQRIHATPQPAREIRIRPATPVEHLGHVGDPHGCRPLKCRAVRVERRPVHRFIALSARPGGVPTAMTKTRLMTDEDLVRSELMAVGYLVPSAADMAIFAIFLSGHVSCVLVRQTFETRRPG
jgi:hypothetical protein